MTKEEARAYIAKLSREEKEQLNALLTILAQRRQRSGVPPVSENKADE